MLSKGYKLKKESDFKRVFSEGEYYRFGLVSLKILKNNLQKNRFACAVGLKVSKKATQRNKIKRKIEEIIRINLGGIKQGFDIVVMVNPEIIEKNYDEIKEELISLFKKAGFFVK